MSMVLSGAPASPGLDGALDRLQRGNYILRLYDQFPKGCAERPEVGCSLGDIEPDEVYVSPHRKLSHQHSQQAGLARPCGATIQGMLIDKADIERASVLMLPEQHWIGEAFPARSGPDER